MDMNLTANERLAAAQLVMEMTVSAIPMSRRIITKETKAEPVRNVDALAELFEELNGTTSD